MKHFSSISHFKIILLLSIFLSFITFVPAQAPSWNWVKSAGGQNNDIPRDITTDLQGNVFATGHFSSDSISFGNIKLFNKSTFGSPDIFVIKYNSNGNVIWAKSFGGLYGDFGNSICTDSNGNIILTGNYNSNSIEFGTYTLLGNGGARIFITMLDPNGNVIWAKTAAGTSDVKGLAISTDKNNFIYTTGYFDSQSIAFNSNIINNNGGADIFVVKYNPLGNAIWAKSFGGSGTDIPYGIANDINGNVYITGRFESDTLVVGSSTHFNLSGNDDIFVIKIDSSGTPLWSHSFGGNSWEEGSAIATDLNSNIYITGYFSSDTLIFGQTKLNNNNNAKIYITKLNPNGNIEWAKTTSTATNDFSFDICTDQNNDVYFTGRFWGNSLTFGSTIIPKSGAVGQTDIFVIKIDASGNDMWGFSIPVGGTNLFEGNDISIDQFGNIYTSGYFTSANVSFPPFSISNLGASDVFVAKLNKTVGYQNLSIKNNTGVSVYPNPFYKETVFYFNIDTFENNIIIELYDITGKKIAQYNIKDSREFIFNRNNISEGIYLYMVKNSTELIGSGKLLIRN